MAFPRSSFNSSFSPLFPPLSALAALALAAALGALGCAQHIGDSCVLSTDCSSQGDRQCDTSMPGGYCTIFNCAPNGCPDYAACYLFHPAVQGCPYNDRQPSRTSESFCMAGCQTDGDCRGGYQCRDARQPPWNAMLLDDNQSQKVCVPNPDPAESVFATEYAAEPDGGAPVCQAFPDVDAAFPPVPDAGAPPPLDAALDSTLGASDAGFDATVPGDSGGRDAASE